MQGPAGDLALQVPKCDFKCTQGAGARLVESHVGGPLALVRDSDLIQIDVEARRIDVLLSDEVLAERRAAWRAPPPRFNRGYGTLYLKHIQQADQGCDFDFLEPVAWQNSIGEPEIH